MPDLAADFLEEIAAVEAKRAELEGQLEEANARDEADDEDGVGAGGDDGEELLDATTLKKQLNVAKKQLKSLQGKLVERLQKSRVAMSDDELRALALTVLQADLVVAIDTYVAEHRQQVIAAVELLHEKYRELIREIEAERDESAAELNRIVAEIGYV